jgi:hypothetical protein
VRARWPGKARDLVISTAVVCSLLFFFLELNNRGSRLVAHSHLQKSISNELDLNDHNEGFSLTRMSYKSGKSDASGSRRKRESIAFLAESIARDSRPLRSSERPCGTGLKRDALESPTAWSLRFVLWVSLLEQRLNSAPTAPPSDRSDREARNSPPYSGRSGSR